MNLNSLSTKITLVFVFTLFLFIATFVFYIEYDAKQVDKQVSSYYEKIANNLMQKRLPRYEVIPYVESFNFETVQNPHAVMRNAKVVYASRGFETIFYNGTYYFEMQAPDFRVMFKDKSTYEKNYYGYFLFAFVFASIIFLYFWLIRSLKPLKELKREIAKFAKGDFNIVCKSDKKDEIAEVANEFDNAVSQISLLLNSRTLFLRTIMHELKTPIAKGRIVSELIEDEKQKNRIINIFEKLNQLINDFAKIEQVVSHNYTPTFYKYPLREILARSVEMLMVDNTDNILFENISDKKLSVDLELISLAIKNLVDNALKYSSDRHVIVQENQNALLVISKGEKLKKPLAEYFKPFHSDTQHKTHGMGLGLYIVYEIAKMHGMNLEYEYKENNNIFKIVYFG